MDQSEFSIQTFVLVLILISYVCSAQLVQVKKIPFIHESVVAIFLGSLTAIFIKLVFKQEIMFSNEVFFTFILPPIIFAAGYSLRKSLFFQNLGLITFLGIFGTIFSFVALSACINFFNNIFFDHLLSISEVMLLSSVLCATDTVTALSLIKPEEAPTLSSVLFGEGVLNDAVAIIIFRSISDFTVNHGEGLSAKEILFLIGNFFYLMFSSLAIGVVFGFGLSYFLKINASLTKTPIKESSLILITGYASYLLSQILGLSGIISLFTCSIIMGHYSYKNLSVESQKGTLIAFDSVGYLSQAFVYAYLGICVLGIKSQMNAILMGFLVIIALPVSRAIPVYILPLFYIICRKKFPLSRKQISICWYSGLIRGAIAFALSLQIMSDHNEFIRDVTLVTVLFTTIVGSVFMKVFVGYKKSNSIQEQKLTDSQKPSNQLREKEDQDQQKSQSIQHLRNQFNTPKQKNDREGEMVVGPVFEEPAQQSRWKRFEKRFILRIFTRGHQNDSAPTPATISTSPLREEVLTKSQQISSAAK